MLGTEYIKVENKECAAGAKYNEFTTLAHARDACTEDQSCSMVYDENCDDSTFYLCPVGSPKRPSAPSIGSCLYVKQGKIKLSLVNISVSWLEYN